VDGARRNGRAQSTLPARPGHENRQVNFNSPAYAVLLFVVFWAYWLRGRLRPRIWMLLVASYIFYGAWNPKYLALIAGTTVLNWWVGLRLGCSDDQKARRRYLALALVGSLGVLAVFKYFNFFIGEINGACAALSLDMAFPTLRVLLPVGISFYTFQTLSYTIDVYRRQIEPTRDIVTFAAFVAFFHSSLRGRS